MFKKPSAQDSKASFIKVRIHVYGICTATSMTETSQILCSTCVYYTFRQFEMQYNWNNHLCGSKEQILKVVFFCPSTFDLSSKSSSDRPGLVPRTLEPAESLSPSKPRPTCRELQLLFLVAMVTCREEKLLKPAEWRRSLEAKRKTS